MKKYVSRGFTLVELMIVIMIIGILAAVIYPQLQGYQESTRDTARISSLKNIQTGIASFYAENNKYPGTNASACILDVKDDLKEHLQNIPTDTKPDWGIEGCTNADQGGFAYKQLGSTSNYVIAANLEKRGKANFAKGGNATGLNTKAFTDANDIEDFRASMSAKQNAVEKTVTKGNWYYVVAQ